VASTTGRSQHIIDTATVEEVISMLNMVAVDSSEMLVPLFQLTQCHIPEHSIFRLTAMRTSNLICISSTKKNTDIFKVQGITKFIMYLFHYKNI